jgi:serine/threonine protein kinase, bacterial
VTSQRLGSRYLLREQIGQGSMGTVWRADDTDAGAPCAVKVLKPEYARDRDAAARFMRQRDALLALRHRNVVALHDMIAERKRLALVMDLVTEGDLDKFRHDRGGTLPPFMAAELIAQVCDGLAAAHAAGIVHRDLKPANVLMDQGRARLTDFAIALTAGETSVSAEGTPLGTVSYLAPEQLTAVPSPACDVYAAGVMLYELLAGRPPFAGLAGAVVYDHLQTAPRRPDGVPDRLWQVTAACLAKDPAARPTAAGLAVALRQPEILDGNTPTTSTWSWLPQYEEAIPLHTELAMAPAAAVTPVAEQRPASRNASARRRTWGIAAAAVLVVGAAVGLVTAYGLRGSSSPAAALAVATSTSTSTSTSQAGATATGNPLTPSPRPSADRATARLSASHPAAASSAAAPVRVTVTAQPPAASTDPAPSPSTTSADPAPAPSTSAAHPVPSVTVTVSVSPVTSCGAFPAGASFWRCTGTLWQATSCATAESNGTSGAYNVLAATNRCGDRVWLHQDAYPQDEKSGWAYCISPGAALKTVPAQYQHPLNIQVSANKAACL